MNTQRNPRYIKLLHAINSCHNYNQLMLLIPFVDAYKKKYTDGADIKEIFDERKSNLMPLVEDEIETIFHRNQCGFNE